MKWIFIFALFFIGCQEKNYFALKKNIQFFFRVLPQQEGIFISEYKSNVLGNGENFLYLYKKNKMIKVPGFADAVPTPDGKILTTPFLLKKDGLIRYEGLNFYQISSDYKFKKIFSDDSLKGKYQSIALMDKKNYRILSDHNGLSLRDYVYQQGTITPLDQVLKLCPIKNYSNQFQLPILSKRGDKFSVFNLRTSTTQIYNILEKGKCRLHKDLGFITGKVDFSPNDQFITYFKSSNTKNHVKSTFYAGQGSYGKNPEIGLDEHLAIFIYDLETGKQIKIKHQSPEFDYYFPSFINSKQIAAFAREKKSKKMYLSIHETN